MTSQTLSSSRSTRLDARAIGCIAAVAIVYGLLLISILIGGEAKIGGALLINFAIPPVLLIANAVYASRATALTHPLRALLFPLLCSAVALPLLFALITPYDGECSVESVCTNMGTWYFNWSTMDQVWYFLLVFAVASFAGFGVTLLLRWVITRSRHS
ncbi:hypothetical protein BLI708_11270 [Bifidobacterium imperatoris]|uniref:Uncharacterized protein n=1 Tax=Bifidobacterium imperatoris TaxID=2020965 RepID=A0A2N5IPW4_9BIFI|nr:hypothetical protein [Bifidobacterium imperatoris]PLS24003.1 hypothetical protein Tam1G_1936 [Bifidobacterium imperatoris]QSY57750.1 hypothetical protein BLI708_11270 [Bifidobacterium imperatoris]